MKNGVVVNADVSLDDDVVVSYRESCLYSLGCNLGENTLVNTLKITNVS